VTAVTIRVERSAVVARVVLARPEVRNAFNAAMIAELTAAFGQLGSEPSIRAIVLAGDGPAFSAGADLEWMRAAAAGSEADNVADALRLADLLAAIRDCPKPVVARVHRAALGGGSGLVAAADITVADDAAVFGFTEARLGLVPAVISPFVLPRIGVAAARELFLTGEVFDAPRAVAIGLIAKAVPEAELDAAVAERVEAILRAGPESQAVVKELIRDVWEHPETARQRTAARIAARRASAEGQEGMRAFLERRPPAWSPEAAAPPASGPE
jgi:methylglutaconyl-CoA hydratase